jgi:hypothetical protein
VNGEAARTSAFEVGSDLEELSVALVITVRRSLFAFSPFPVHCSPFTGRSLWLYRAPWSSWSLPFTVHCSLFAVRFFTIPRSLFTVHRF